MSWTEKVFESDAGRTARGAAQRLIESVGEEVRDLPRLPPAPLLASSPNTGGADGV